MNESLQKHLINDVFIPYYQKKQVSKETIDSKLMFKGYTKTNKLLTAGISLELGTGQAYLYIVLLGHKNNKTNKCYPSISTLCLETGLTRNTVEKYISELTEKGYILVNSGNSYGFSNSYYFPYEDDYEEPENTPHKRKGKWKPSENNNNDFFKSLLNISQTEEEKEDEYNY